MSMKNALIIAAIFIVAMFVFDRVMMAKVNSWASQTVEIPASQRLLLGIALLWDRSWLILSPVIVGIMLLVSALINRSASRS
jgi:Na+/H+ antiporter NhaC